MSPEPATSHDFTDEERREQAQAWRLEQAEAQLRAAQRAADADEQTPEMLTLRTLQRIERLLEDRLPARVPGVGQGKPPPYVHGT